MSVVFVEFSVCVFRLTLCYTWYIALVSMEMACCIYVNLRVVSNCPTYISTLFRINFALLAAIVLGISHICMCILKSRCCGKC